MWMGTACCLIEGCGEREHQRGPAYRRVCGRGLFGRAWAITTAEKILDEVRTLPEAHAREVLNFVAFLKARLVDGKSAQRDMSAFDRSARSTKGSSTATACMTAKSVVPQFVIPSVARNLAFLRSDMSFGQIPRCARDDRIQIATLPQSPSLTPTSFGFLSRFMPSDCLWSSPNFAASD
jgi:hypothetical protein